ncbi:hypothetical protein L3Q82_019588 [Scortum barcoo]|uniref:Uncharacterized protein n=1 Tax=Scortum barcoo TaxID=214431 RepID=A0ACB8VBI4_9TELE|nr:hypothetical protein L3Q82_019588 [Scortum barcoo]
MKRINIRKAEGPDKHIKDIIPAGLDQYQFAYRENRLTEDAVSIALHTALTHLQLAPNILCEDAICGLQFSLQHSDPGQADAEASITWDCPHRCAIGSGTSSPTGLRCKTKEVIVDYRRSRRTEHAPLLIHGEAVERVNNIKFLGIHITSDLTWSMNTAHLPEYRWLGELCDDQLVMPQGSSSGNRSPLPPPSLNTTVKVQYEAAESADKSLTLFADVKAKSRAVLMDTNLSWTWSSGSNKGLAGTRKTSAKSH